MGKATKPIKQPITKGAAKVPVIMQMEALECGAASLTMILAYYGCSSRGFRGQAGDRPSFRRY